MVKDQMEKDEEISAEDLEQVSGGMAIADINTVKLHKEFPSLAVDKLQKVNTLEPDPWEKTRQRFAPVGTVKLDSRRLANISLIAERSAFDFMEDQVMTDKDKSTKDKFPDTEIGSKAGSPNDTKDTRSSELNEKELEQVSGGARISKNDLLKLQKK